MLVLAHPDNTAVLRAFGNTPPAVGTLATFVHTGIRHSMRADSGLK